MRFQQETAAAGNCLTVEVIYNFTYSNAAGDSVYTDHTYTVKLYTSTSAAAPGTVTDNGVELKDSEEVRTLKSLPTIGKLVGNAQTGYFDLYVDGIYVNGMNDTSSVSLWTYYIKDASGNLVRTLTSKTSDAVQLVVDGESIKYGEPYTATAEVTIYDNEKNIVLPTTEDPRGVQLIMYASGDSFVYYTEAASSNGIPGTTFNSFIGTLSVVPNQRQILVGGGHDLYVQVENTAGTYKGDKEVVDYQPGLQNTIITMTGNQKIEFVVSKNLLAQGSDYVISVYGDYYEKYNEDGTADLDSLVKQGLIGKYVVSTKKSMPLFMVLDELDGDDAITSKLRAKLSFPNETTLNRLNWQNESDRKQVEWTSEQREQYEYMLSQIEEIEVTLYKGSAAIESNRQGNTFVIKGQNIRTLYDDTSGTDSDGIQITESSFGLSADMISGSYYIKVTAVYDKTTDHQNEGANLGYRNLISGLMPVAEANNRFTLTSEVALQTTAQSALPELPTAGDGVEVTPIYNGPGNDSSKMYADAYGLDNDPKLASDTIVGYYVQANYDATCEKVDAVTYYIMQSGVVEDYYKDSSNFNVAGDPVSYYENDSSQDGVPFKFTIPVLKNSAWTMPSLIVYFGDVDNSLKTGDFNSVNFNSTAGYNNAEQSIVTAYGGSKSVNEIYGTLKNENGYNETDFRGVQTSGANPVFYHINKDNTTTAVVCAPALSRGHHYTFAYKTRVDMGTGDTYIYPDNSQYHYSSGDRKSFLSSQTVSVWKQPITADTFLYESGLSGSISPNGLVVKEGPDGAEGLTEKKTYKDGLVQLKYGGMSTDLNDFFIWKYWMKDPDGAQPSASQAFATTAAQLIAYMPPKTDDSTGKMTDYGLLFFESASAVSTSSMTTDCTVTVQQKLFNDDDSFQNGYAEKENWYCGDENNSYTIAYRNSSAASTTVNLIGGTGRTPSISRKVDMSALKWDVNMNNNVAVLSAQIDPNRTSEYPAGMLTEFMKQILYLDVEATLSNNTTVTKRFSSNNGTYSLEVDPDNSNSYRIRWDVTLLQGIKTGDIVDFTVHCYYDTGFGTMDAVLLQKDIVDKTTTILKAGTGDTFNAAYVLQNLVDKMYVIPGTVSSETSWTTSSAATVGKIPFYELAQAISSDGSTLPVEASDWTGIQLFGKSMSYNNYTNSAETDTVWWNTQVPGTTHDHQLLMKFYRETGGMKMAEGADLNYTYKKVGYYTFTDTLNAPVTQLTPSMTHTSSVRGLTYLDYYIACGSQNLLTQSEQTIYLKLYDMSDQANPKDVTDTAEATVTQPAPETPLQRVTIDEKIYYKWKLTNDITNYRIRFSSLYPGTTYGLEAYAYPDVSNGGNVSKGTFTKVIDAGADNNATYKDVQKENPNFQLTTQNSVKLTNVRATYINDWYMQKGLEVHFTTNVYEGYKILCKIYETKADGNYSDSDTPVYAYEQILKQYTPENNTAYMGGVTGYENYNYLANTTTFNTGDNTFWIPFPPSTSNRLTGGANYTVVLQAVTADDSNTNLNDHTDSTREAGYEFITDGIAVSKGAAYAITSTGRAKLSEDGKQNILDVTLIANDPNHQIVDDKYSFFIKRVKDENGTTLSSKNILGINEEGKLCWMTTETGTGAEEATNVTISGNDAGIWTQDITVKDTMYSKSFSLTGLPAGTYEIYTMAQIDLEANGQDTKDRVILTAFRQTAQTVTDNVMEGRIFTKTQLVDGKWKLILRLSGWQNLDKVSSAMCLVVNTDLSYHETFADCTSYLKESDPRIELVLDGAKAGDYVVTLNMSTKSGNVEVPVTLNNREITFSIQ